MELRTSIEINVQVFADYQPHEAETLESPAVEADIENIWVFHGESDITDFLSSDQLENIKSQLWEQLEKENEE